MPSNRREVKVYITGDATGLSKSLDKAEGRLGGMSGKMKGLFAGIGVATIGRGVMNVANEFQDAAISANDFATASGLSVEAASRWQEVAGDLGVDATKLESTIGRMSKTVGKDEGKWRDLGLTIAKTDDGITDVNGTFKNALDLLRDTEDPLERAQLGTELFGRSWMDMAPLLELSAADLETQLTAVGDAQVINEEEVEKAKRMRETMDELNDATMGVKLAVAEALLPAISGFAGFLANNMNPTLATTIGALAGSVGLAWAIGKVTGAIQGTIWMLDTLKRHPVIAATVVVFAGIGLIIKYWDDITAAVDRAIAAVDRFQSKLGGGLTSVLNKIPGVSIGEHNWRDGLTPAGLAHLESKEYGRRAAGGPVLGGMPYLVGERGPELFVPNTPGRIVSNGDLSRGRPVQNFHIYPAPGMDERVLARAVAREVARSKHAAGLSTL